MLVMSNYYGFTSIQCVLEGSYLRSCSCDAIWNDVEPINKATVQIKLLTDADFG